MKSFLPSKQQSGIIKAAVRLQYITLHQGSDMQIAVSVIKRTWGNVKGIIVKYFSNVTDPAIPTEDTGVPNVPTGALRKSDCISELSLFPLIIFRTLRQVLCYS